MADQLSTLGIDLGKNFFQIHGAGIDGTVLFRKKVSRTKLLGLVASQPRCLVAMEACASAHYWGREIMRLGHEVKLIPPKYVKPFVKRDKSDAADAEAIVEAVQRPTMRTVAVKSEAQQALAMVFNRRRKLANQRTRLINQLRGHMAEFGVVAPQGAHNVTRLEDVIEAENTGLPIEVIEMAREMIQEIDSLGEKIDRLFLVIKRRLEDDPNAARLKQINGIGPITAVAFQALLPPMESFRNGRCVASYLGLTPREMSTGGKQRIGPITKAGPEEMRSLLVLGATSVLK